MEKLDLAKFFENDEIIWLDEDKSILPKSAIEITENKKEINPNFVEKLIIFHAEEGDFRALFHQILSAKPIQFQEKDWVLIHQKDLSYQDYIRLSKDQDKFVLVLGIKENLSEKILVNQIMHLRNKRFLYTAQTIQPIASGSMTKEEKVQFWANLKSLILID